MQPECDIDYALKYPNHKQASAIIVANSNWEDS